MRMFPGSRCLAAVGAVLLGLGASGCGGGGGGGGSSTPTIPGTLHGLAIQGSAAPAPVNGTFGLFLPDMLLSAAEGGWVAFVADVVGGTSNRALFVARPNGTIVSVYARNDLIPANISGTGAIDQFRRIWMRPGGIVVADVDITAGTTTRGFITARVDAGGNVVEKAGAFYLTNDLPNRIGGGSSGKLDDIHEDATEVSDTGKIAFWGSTTTALEGVFGVLRDGTGAQRVAVSGDGTGSVGEVFGMSFPAIAIDENSTVVGFAATVSGLAATNGIFATQNAIQYLRVADNLDLAPNSGAGRFFTNVFEGRRLLLAWPGGLLPGYLVWRGGVTGAAPNHGLFRRQILNGGILSPGPLLAVIGAGETLNGVGVGAFSSDETVYDGEINAGSSAFRTDVAGGSTSLVFARLFPVTGVFGEMWRQGAPAPGGSTFETSYPSLGTVKRADAGSRDGSFAFSAVLADASSGVFWDVFGDGRFAIAKQTDPAPDSGGALFGSFGTASSVSTAFGNVAFRAALVGGGGASGIFRQN